MVEMGFHTPLYTFQLASSRGGVIGQGMIKEGGSNINYLSD